MVLLLASCTQSASTPSSTKSPSSTVSFALPVNQIPNYPFPLDSAAVYYFANTNDLQQLMYPPLYWFSQGSAPLVNAKASFANLPVFSNDNKTVTITLKHIMWSNGRPLTSRDVEFWMNLLIAEKSIWADYVPGAFPDNLVSEQYPSATKIVFTFNHSYNPKWILYNELSQIYPLPQSVWDRTSASGPVGNYDLTTSGAQAVYSFLNAQSQKVAEFTTNPLWKVVDGAWLIKTYNPTTGYIVFSRNAAFSGLQAGSDRVTTLEEFPYTSAQAEVDALRGGSIDYGYLPANDVGLEGYFRSHGYAIAPLTSFTISYIAINFTNPTMAPVFDQLYVRQALQYLVNQPLYIQEAWGGNAYPTYGPVPTRPSEGLFSSAEQHFPYNYNPGKAKSLLSAHGWAVVNGALTCVHSGSGSGDCGAGIRQGMLLAFSFPYASGSAPMATEFEAYKSALSSVGIDATLTQLPTSQILANDFTCNSSTQVGCSWGLTDPNDFWTYDPDYFPTGGEIFGTGAGSNEGGYSSQGADALITQTHTSPSLSTFFAYENYIATQLPVIWIPTPYYQISVISNTISGAVPQSPIAFIYPERWQVK